MATRKDAHKVIERIKADRARFVKALEAARNGGGLMAVMGLEIEIESCDRCIAKLSK